MTGKSLFDIDYKKTIKSEIPGEKTSPQQPFPKKPKKFSFVEFKEEYLKDELIKNTNFMSKFREKYVYGWFTPPEIGRDLIYLPGEIIGKGVHSIQILKHCLFLQSLFHIKLK